MGRRPALVEYNSVQEYRNYFEEVYCQGPIETHDGILVRFRKQQFDHAFFESIAGAKDSVFSNPRAQRVDWIKWTLENPNAELYVGWDNKRKRTTPNRRVAIVNDDYVVIIRLGRGDRAEFVTAFVADHGTIGKIRLNGRWAKKYR